MKVKNAHHSVNIFNMTTSKTNCTSKPDTKGKFMKVICLFEQCFGH